MKEGIEKYPNAFILCFVSVLLLSLSFLSRCFSVFHVFFFPFLVSLLPSLVTPHQRTPFCSFWRLLCFVLVIICSVSLLSLPPCLTYAHSLDINMWGMSDSAGAEGGRSQKHHRQERQKDIWLKSAKTFLLPYEAFILSLFLFFFVLLCSFLGFRFPFR